MAKAAKKYIPGLGVDFQIQADEIDAGVVIGDLAGFFTSAEVAADFDAASIGRDRLIADVAAIHGVDLFTLKQPTGIPLTASLAAGLHAVLVASHVRTVVGELADGNTKTSVSHIQFVLPDNYKAGGAITLRIATKLKSVTGTGVTDNGSDTDASAYVQAHGAVGADIVTTNAQVYAALDTWYDKDFVITPTSRVAGDVLNIEITQRAIESNAGNGTLQSYIGEISLLLDVQG